MIVTINDIPVYDAIISDEETGMFKISLVDDPAVMSNFQAFDNTRKQLMYAVANEEKRLVRGVVMRADFPIYRADKNMGEYYVIYKADQIRKMAEKYLEESRQNDVNIMHQENSDVDGVNMVQYFIKDTEGGINPKGFEDISDGTLFAEFHVVNDVIWDAIKEGTFKGFSLEGVFDLQPEQDAEKVEDIVDSLAGAFSKLFSTNKIMSKMSKFKEALAKLLQEFGNVTTDKGVIAWDGEEDLQAGDAVFVTDAEGNRSSAADGEYRTEDNKVIVVVDGKVAEIKDAEAEVESQFGRKNTDKGEILWEGEEDLVAGIAVFVEREGERIPAEDGEYITEDGKIIVVAEGKVAEIRDNEAEVAPAEPANEELSAIKAENETLKAEKDELLKKIEELNAKVTKLEKMSAAKPAHDEVATSSKVSPTGNKGLDRLARYMSAK